MDVLDGFSEFETQGPPLQHIGPIQGGLLSTLADFALGADADDDRSRAAVSLTVEGRETVRARAVFVVTG